MRKSGLCTQIYVSPLLKMFKIYKLYYEKLHNDEIVLKCYVCYLLSKIAGVHIMPGDIIVGIKNREILHMILNIRIP